MSVNIDSTVRVGELPPAPFGLTDKLPHEIGDDLKQGTVQELADAIKDYLGTISGLAFNPTTVPDGGNLPNTDSNEWILVGKGTFHNVGGAPDITTTEELNALTSNGSFWTLSVEIPINIEFTGITQSVRSGYTQTVPSEDAVYKAIQNIYLSIKASNIGNDSTNVSGENVANAMDNLQLNKLDKVSAVTPESQIYAKQADGTQAMFDIEKPSFEGIRYSEAYSGNIKSLGIDREILSNFNGVIPSSKAVTTGLNGKVTSNVAITGSTKTKITYDSKGLVTSGSDAGISDITGLVSALSLKEDKSNKNIASGYAGLDSSGKLFANQIPAIAVTDTFVVNSQAAMLVLSTAEIGDVAVRTDLNKTFILKANPYSVLANWQELLTPTSPVTSVFGRVGPISANSGDYTTALVTENTNKNYQTDAQRANNDATSSIQTQLNNRVTISGTQNTIQKKGAGNTLVDSIIKEAGDTISLGAKTGASDTPTNLCMDSTFTSSPASTSSLKYYLLKAQGEAYGFGLGDNSDIRYWAGADSGEIGRHVFYCAGNKTLDVSKTISTFNTRVSASPAVLDTELATLGQVKASGATSGTYTPTFSGLFGISGTPTVTAIRYSKIGTLITVTGTISLSTDSTTGIRVMAISLPFNAINNNSISATGSVNVFTGTTQTIIPATGNGNVSSSTCNFNFFIPSSSTAVLYFNCTFNTN